MPRFSLSERKRGFFLAPATGPLGPRWYDEGAASEEEEEGGEEEEEEE